MSKNKLFEAVEIFDIGSRGQTIAKSDEGIVLMVKNGVPGDIVDIKTYRKKKNYYLGNICLLYTSPSPRDRQKSRMPSSA